MTGPGADAGPHDAYAALRSANYRRFAGGWLCSVLVLQMLATAVGWEIYQRTDSPLHLGLVGLVQAVPVVLLAIVGGHTADVADRRRIIAVTQVGFALGAALLAAASLWALPLIVTYAALAGMACVRAFSMPARASILPLVVEPHEFQNAVTWNSSVFQFSALAGPVAAGGIIALTGAAWPVYAAGTAGTLVFAVTILTVRTRPQEALTEPRSGRTMLAGMSHVWRERTIFAALSLDMLAVLFGGATALFPVYARDILGTGPVGLGLLRAAPYAGALAMALVLAHRPPFRRAGPALLGSVAGYGAAMVVFGLSGSLRVALGALLVAGALDEISVVVRHVLVQVRTPDALRGRVSAVNSIFIECSNELGSFESGLVARFFGPVVAVVSGGLGTIAVTGLIGWTVPAIRRLGVIAPAPPAPRPEPARDRTSPAPAGAP